MFLGSTVRVQLYTYCSCTRIHYCKKLLLVILYLLVLYTYTYVYLIIFRYSGSTKVRKYESTTYFRNTHAHVAVSTCTCARSSIYTYAGTEVRKYFRKYSISKSYSLEVRGHVLYVYLSSKNRLTCPICWIPSYLGLFISR